METCPVGGDGKDVSNMDGEVWNSCLAAVPLVSVSATQKQSHLFLLHRLYRIPQQLHKWGYKDSSLCPKCQLEKCFCYWTKLISTISHVYNYQLKSDPAGHPGRGVNNSKYALHRRLYVYFMWCAN